MKITKNDVLEFVRENDVKFVRLAFCDLFGTVKNIAIMAQELPRAFEDGISFDASAVEGFLNVERSDLFLHPDPETPRLLPWSPGRGGAMRMYCDIRHPDGKPFEGDGRMQLKQAARRAAEKGYICQVGAECEFYLFELDDKGNPTRLPIDKGSYMDMPPIDRGENVRRDICLMLEEMDIVPECAHHEQGPGQNEIDFRYSDILTAADRFITFKTAVKTAAAQNGMHASFLPKPLEGKPGSGLHVNMSLVKDGKNLFDVENTPRGEAEWFIAGVLEHVGAITAVLNPLTNSYARFGEYEAPRYISWSHANRSQLVRIPSVKGEYNRMELRSPDPTCNPYLAFALLLEAGMDGIERKLSLPPPADLDLYTADPAVLAKLKALPQSLGEAVLLMEQSDFVRRTLPESIRTKFADAKRREQAALDAVRDKRAHELRLTFDTH